MLLITIYTVLHTIWRLIVVLVAALCIVPTLTFVLQTAKYITLNALQCYYARVIDNTILPYCIFDPI